MRRGGVSLPSRTSPPEGLPVTLWGAKSRASSTIWNAMPMFSPYAAAASTRASSAPARRAPSWHEARISQAVLPRMISSYSSAVVST